MKLSPQHHQAITLLTDGMSNKKTAEKLNVAPETISRWKSDFTFQAELNGLLKANHKIHREKLRRLNGVALDTIQNVMTDEQAPHKDKITAAFKVLELTKLKQSTIGSSNPEALQKESEEAALLDGYGY